MCSRTQGESKGKMSRRGNGKLLGGCPIILSCRSVVHGGVKETVDIFVCSLRHILFLPKKGCVLPSPARTPVCFYRFTTLTKTGTQIILRRHKLHGMVMSFVKANTRPRTKVNSLSGYFCLQ